MAKLLGGNTELTIRPYRVAEPGNPGWLLTEVRLTQDSKDLLHTTVSLTRADLLALRGALLDVAAGRRSEISVEGTDADFAFEAERLVSAGDVAVKLWEGEPYQLMRGWRFVAEGSALVPFADALLADENAAAPAGHFP